MAEGAQHIGERIRGIRVVIDEEDATALDRGRDGRRRLGLRRQSGLSRNCREANDELASFSGPRAVSDYLAPVESDDVLHDCEAEPKTALRARLISGSLVKPLEHMRKYAGGDSDSVVLDPNHRLLTRTGRAYRNRSSRIGVFCGIGQKICDHLLQAGRVPGHREPLFHLEGQLMAALLDQRSGDLSGVGDNLAHLQHVPPHLHLAAGDSRNIEEVIHQPHQLRDLTFDDLVLAAPIVPPE